MSANVAVRPFLLKPQWMNGLSERLLVSHYVNNYGGALRRLNAIRARLAALDWERTPVFEINGLKREELIAGGSVILHEIYFDSLGGHGDDPPTGSIEPPTGLSQALERDFGSISAWTTEFTAMAKALAGGSGWAILAWSERLGRLLCRSGDGKPELGTDWRPLSHGDRRRSGRRRAASPIRRSGGRRGADFGGGTGRGAQT